MSRYIIIVDSMEDVAKSYKPCAVYDFRYSAVVDDAVITPEQIISYLKGIAKSYVFQKEKGDTGYEHYQGRLSLIKKRRKFEALKIFKNPPQYFEPTCNPEFLKGEAFYQIKEDTRILGPWKDTDEEIYIPRQIREITKLRPFQQQIVDSLTEWQPRVINCVIDTKGNNGKSILIGWIRAYRLGRCLPPINDTKDMMRMVCDMPTSNAYIIDMPRAMKKDSLGGFYTAIEMLKDGYAYDDRYHFREKVFDRPVIWLLTNIVPDTNILSADRWKFWKIQDNELKSFHFCNIEN